MQIHNESIKKLTSLSDSELEKIISLAAAESGISLPDVSGADLARIRALLNTVNAGDPSIIKAVDDISKSIKKSPRADSSK